MRKPNNFKFENNKSYTHFWGQQDYFNNKISLIKMVKRKSDSILQAELHKFYKSLQKIYINNRTKKHWEQTMQEKWLPLVLLYYSL